jgi:hypothetical protein
MEELRKEIEETRMILQKLRKDYADNPTVKQQITNTEKKLAILVRIAN